MPERYIRIMQEGSICDRESGRNDGGKGSEGEQISMRLTTQETTVPLGPINRLLGPRTARLFFRCAYISCLLCTYGRSMIFVSSAFRPVSTQPSYASTDDSRVMQDLLLTK